MDPQIAYLVSRVASRYRTVRFAKLLAFGWILVAVATVVLSQLGLLPKFSIWYLLGAIAAIAGLW